ncbi:MAG: Grx4 family monothiol glutaredoxin [Bdellovibrionota bacterium]
MADPTFVKKVDEQVKANPVMIYMKGSPESPMCGFSARAVAVLREAGATKMVSVDVLQDDMLWDALEEYSKWPTVPQIFINGQFVGGCDIISEMHETGELAKLLHN